MNGFYLTCIRYQLRLESSLTVGFNTGSQFRGALYRQLQQMLAAPRNTQGDTVFVGRIMAPRNPQSDRGRDVARPYSLYVSHQGQPIQERRFLEAGDELTVQLTLFGDTVDSFKLFTVALAQVGTRSLHPRGGAYKILNIENVQPLTSVSVSLMGNGVTRLPEMTITDDDIQAYVATLSGDRIGVRFLTPMRLIQHKKLVKSPHPEPLVARLVGRLEALEKEYGTPSHWRERYLDLTQHARQCWATEVDVRWIEVKSGSRRQQRATFISGFIGAAQFEGNLKPLLPYLVWGSLVQVGKDVVKGNGFYTLHSALTEE